jgi:hypothetical protein
MGLLEYAVAGRITAERMVIADGRIQIPLVVRKARGIAEGDIIRVNASNVTPEEQSQEG